MWHPRQVLLLGLMHRRSLQHWLQSLVSWRAWHTGMRSSITSQCRCPLMPWSDLTFSELGSETCRGDNSWWGCCLACAEEVQPHSAKARSPVGQGGIRSRKSESAGGEVPACHSYPGRSENLALNRLRSMENGGFFPM